MEFILMLLISFAIFVMIISEILVTVLIITTYIKVKKIEQKIISITSDELKNYTNQYNNERRN